MREAIDRVISGYNSEISELHDQLLRERQRSRALEARLFEQENASFRDQDPNLRHRRPPYDGPPSDDESISVNIEPQAVIAFFVILVAFFGLATLCMYFLTPSFKLNWFIIVAAFAFGLIVKQSGAIVETMIAAIKGQG